MGTSGLTIARLIIVVLLSATIAVSLVPLSVLLAYVVRIALIAQRTAAFGPFIPEDEQQRISGQVTMGITEFGRVMTVRCGQRALEPTLVFSGIGFDRYIQNI